MIVAMLVVPAMNVSADAMDITDYVPVQNGTYLDGKITKITSYNGTNYDYGVEINELEDNIFEFYTKDSRATIPSSIARPQGGLQYDLNNKPITKGDKYVFVIKVRKVNESDVVPNLVFGIADAAMGGKDAGWDGKHRPCMLVTSPPPSGRQWYRKSKSHITALPTLVQYSDLAQAVHMMLTRERPNTNSVPVLPWR